MLDQVYTLPLNAPAAKINEPLWKRCKLQKHLTVCLTNNILYESIDRFISRKRVLPSHLFSAEARERRA